MQEKSKALAFPFFYNPYLYWRGNYANITAQASIFQERNGKINCIAETHAFAAVKSENSFVLRVSFYEKKLMQHNFNYKSVYSLEQTGSAQANFSRAPKSVF